MTDNTQPQTWRAEAHPDGDWLLLEVGTWTHGRDRLIAEDLTEADAKQIEADHAAAAKLTAAYAEADALAQALAECKDEGLEHHSECAKWEHPGTSWSLNPDTPCDCYLLRVVAALTAHAERVKARNGIIPLDERRHV